MFYLWCNCPLMKYVVFRTLSLLGLGTSTSKEAKEYFSDMERHRIPFKYIGTEDDASIQLVSENRLK